MPYITTVSYISFYLSYTRLARYQAALSDALKCIEIDATWTKGYIRKGDAYYALAKYTEAYNAYNAGLRVAPDDNLLKEKSEMSMVAIRRAAESSQSSSSSSGRGGWGSADSSTSQATSVVHSQLSRLCGALKLFVVLTFFAYVLPIGSSINRISYKLFAVSALADYAIALYVAHGMPQFNAAYGQRALTDPSAMYVLMSFTFICGHS